MNQAMVLTSVVFVSGSAVIKQLADGKGFQARTVAGGFVYGAFLFLLNEFNGSIAKALAILVTTSALLLNGPTVLSAVQKAL